MPLRLKSLELHGYKTFASRTSFEFGEGITAIVGPNGSGKSNITDALRWVLGEQSYSLLRGKKTEDMIFSGSEHRPRAGMASASILFDNDSNWLPVDFSEVELARRAYRDGRNEYLLNNQHVRLRDFNELLAQSGLGERTYTIIGQGLVDASLAIKADERRRLFEEAAGVGLYRTRREEALRRLETTARNLERVLDIMAELEPRLRSLERQARRAQEYSQAQADLNLLLREWYGFHWHQSQKDLTASRETLRQQEARTREARQVFRECQQESTDFREHLQGLRARLNSWHRESSELHSQRESVSKDLAVLEERRRSLTQTSQTLLLDQDRSQGEEQLARERLAEVEQELERLQAEYDDALNQQDIAQSNLQARQAERKAVEDRLRTAHNSIDKFNAQRTELQARMDELQTRISTQRTKLESAEQAIQASEGTVRQSEKQHSSMQSRRDAAETSLEKAEAELKERQARTAELEQAHRQQQEQLSARQNEHSRAKAQLEVLEQAEQSLTGYADGARFLLDAARQSRLGGTRGALSSALDVPAELETAIAAALGDHLDAILIESGRDTEQALDLLDSDSAGRAALLPLEWLSKSPALKVPRDADCLGLASTLVKVSGELRPAVDLLLGQTLVVRDRAAARRLLSGLDGQARAVTLKGEVFRADGSVLAGKQARSGTLSRPRQRRELQQALADLEERLAQLESSVSRLAGELAEARRLQSEGETAVRQARTVLDEAQKAEQQARLEFESAKRQFEFQKSQREQLQSEITQAEQERRQAELKQEQVENEAFEAQEQAKALSTELADLLLDEVQEQVTYWGTRLAVAERALGDVRSRQGERKQALERLANQAGDLQRRHQDAEQALAELDREKESLRTRETELNEKLEALRVKTEPAEKDLETAEQQEVQLQAKETESQRLMTIAERNLSQVQVDLARRQEGLDSLRQRVQDDFGLVSFEYNTDVSGPVPLPFDGMVEQLPVVTEINPELEEHMTQQRARLRRMGPINPEAETEFDSERERYEFMKTQVEDLNKAEADLKQVIAELDELTKREFQKTFEAVDHEFRDIFVRLFGGGSARLTLTDPDNLIDTGIDIEARLPGRREQGLALLSGGERTLTAIALVFALLRISPTPLCVLDEVDAMLDEANVGRFRDMLAELSKRTQFVIVTHNRNTVQVADVIYGVTMGRDSASQIISLRLDEVSDEYFR